MIIERRDQVLIGRLLPAARASSTFLDKWESMNGPFLTERGTNILPNFSFDVG
jgi:hypothetical protein